MTLSPGILSDLSTDIATWFLHKDYEELFGPESTPCDTSSDERSLSQKRPHSVPDSSLLEVISTSGRYSQVYSSRLTSSETFHELERPQERSIEVELYKQGINKEDPRSLEGFHSLRKIIW